MTLGALAFLNPWLLAGLVSLPIIYWLLRTVPPRPRQIAFPATRILVGLRNRERTPAQTPWWLMLIRLAAAGLVILALAEPVMNPAPRSALKGTGPVAVVVDNSWAAAAQWNERLRMVDRLIAEAEGQGRAVVMVPTAITGKAPTLRVESPADARSTAAALQPQPFPPVRAAVGDALAALLAKETESSVVWLTDGIDHDGATAAFAEQLARVGRAGFAVIETGTGREALGLASSLGQGGRLDAVAMRAEGGPRGGSIYAFSERGQRLGEATFKLAPGETRATATFELPLELRNQVVRLEIAGEHAAGAVQLLDGRSQWHRVGLISGESLEEAQPFLAPLYYIDRAMRPFSELAVPNDANVATAIASVLKQNASVIVLADIGTLTGSTKAAVEDWVKKGGVLVRFAGPRLEKGGDDLIPVALRQGGRTLGGALSWSTPQPLAPFTDDSLFAGLAVPADVTVNRQVLADPSRLGTGVKVWARLKDGTPLVTATDRGRGQIVLFHVTANADWSNLPLSGLFVEMLRRISTLGRIGGPQAGGSPASNTVAASAETPVVEANPTSVLAPHQILDGFGLLKSPPPTAQSIPAARLAETKPSADYPPGYYGPQGSTRALNLLDAKSTLKPLPPLPAGTSRRAYEGQAATPLKPTLLTLALALLFTDIAAVMLLQMGSVGLGGLASLLRGGAARAGARVGAVVLLAAIGAGGLGLGLASPPAEAQSGNRDRPSPFTFPSQPGRDFIPGLPRGLQQPRDEVQIVRPGKPSSIPESQALKATSKVTFGFVVSGDAGVDDISRQGLNGLIRELERRTAVNAGAPVGIDIVSDDIAFFPVIYWPVLGNARALPEATLSKLDAYMKEGGMVIFDTRDFGQGMPSGFAIQGAGDNGTPLQRLLGKLDIPRLEAVPEGHVLTKSFYLLRSFPGRWDGGQLWVEADANEAGPDAGRSSRKARRSDGVSSILVTSNDFASAWAQDENSRPLYPAVPGGEYQREMAYRTGINIVMYALTGNYKADQVHVPALLERLGQ